MWLKKYISGFFYFLILVLIFQKQLQANTICNKIINSEYYFPEKFINKFDHGIVLEDFNDPNSDRLFIISIDNFSPAKKLGLKGLEEIHSINGIEIFDDSKESFEDTIDYAYSLMDKDNFLISVFDENDQLVEYDISKSNYNGEPSITSQYEIDKLEIFNLNRDVRGRFRIWTHWENPNFIEYVKINFSDGKDFKCNFTNLDNIEKILQKLWYPIARVDQIGSQFDILNINSVSIDSTLESDQFGIEYDVETSVMTNTNLKKFPFDEMYFSFDFNYFNGGNLNLIEDWEEQIEQAVERTNQNLYEWQITNADLYYFQDVYILEGEDTFPGHEIYFDLKRNTLYYFIKIILPVIFIVFISFGVFWIKNKDLEAKLNVSIVSLLALIAYNFVYNSELPKLNFITIIDAFILISYFYSGLATIVTIYSYYDYRRDQQKGDFNTLDLKLRLIAPLSYTVLIAIVSFLIYSS